MFKTPLHVQIPYSKPGTKGILSRLSVILNLLREHFLDFFVTKSDLVYWVSLSLKRFEVALNV